MPPRPFAAHCCRLLVAACLSLAAAVPAGATDLDAFTEALPPLNYEAHGQVVGFSSELLDLMAADAGISVRKQLLPWQRAYETVTRQANTLIYSLVRTPERETLFQWVGPISARRMMVYRHRDRTDITVRTLDDARAYRIGVTLESAAAKSLAQQGFARASAQQAPGPGLDMGLNDQANVKKFLARRFDLLVMLDWAAAYHVRAEGLDPDVLQPVLVLDDASSYWYGVSLNTPPELVKKLNTALQKIKADGRYQQLRHKYLSKSAR